VTYIPLTYIPLIVFLPLPAWRELR
jgi:hypothetical protein